MSFLHLPPKPLGLVAVDRSQGQQGREGRRRKALDAIEAYFPAVVGREMFDDVALSDLRQGT